MVSFSPQHMIFHNQMTVFFAYPDAAHVLPVLFSFTTPAKFCFRAIATFCKHVTGLAPTPSSPIASSFPSLSPRQSFRGRSSKPKLNKAKSARVTKSEILLTTVEDQQGPISSYSEPSERKSLRRSLSTSIYRATSVIRPRPPSHARSEPGGEVPAPDSRPPLPNREDSTTSSDVGGPRFRSESPTIRKSEDLTAGNTSVYGELSVGTAFLLFYHALTTTLIGTIMGWHHDSRADIYARYHTTFRA